MPETLYPRSQMLSQAPITAAGEDAPFDLEKISRRRSNASISDLPRTRKLPFINAIRPVPGMRHPKPWDSLLRFVQLFKQPVVFIAVFAYCFVSSPLCNIGRYRTLLLHV